ncbi:MAG: hypothetical protein KAH22_04970 [Thiotrichaceae bacterium]|nr:hypothetical protein [Thiotrichaceae bacterium]
MRNIIPISATILLALSLSCCSDNESSVNTKTHVLGTVSPSMNSLFDKKINDLLRSDKITLDPATLDLNFDIQAAKGVDGHLSLCTDYIVNNNSEYDINYESCKLNTVLANGHYNSSIKLNNDVNSLIGVVLFDDISIAPIYKEFKLSEAEKFVFRNDSKNHVLSWN